MRITLKPELERFIEERVKAGAYPSADAVVEAAIIYMRDSELDDETIAAINEGSEQARRGEGTTLDEVRAHMKKRMQS
jgi:putative addiction module CopG family antidote